MLASLADDPRSLSRRVDWVIKREMLESQIARRSLDWDSPIVKELDIKYHAIAPQRSIYHLLCGSGGIDRVVTAAEVNEKLTEPPPETRAALRVHLMKALGPLALAVNWDCVLAYNPRGKQLVRLHMPDPRDNGATLTRRVLSATDPAETILENWPAETIALRETNNA